MKKRKIDGEIEKIIQQKREISDLEAELKKREEIVMKKELLLTEKYELEMKKLRSSQILSKVKVFDDIFFTFIFKKENHLLLTVIFTMGIICDLPLYFKRG